MLEKLKSSSTNEMIEKNLVLDDFSCSSFVSANLGKWKQVFNFVSIEVELRSIQRINQQGKSTSINLSLLSCLASFLNLLQKAGKCSTESI